MNLNETKTETAAHAVMQAMNQELRDVHGTPVLLAPEGFTALEMAHLLPAPTRRTPKPSRKSTSPMKCGASTVPPSCTCAASCPKSKPQWRAN